MWLYKTGLCQRCDLQNVFLTESCQRCNQLNRTCSWQRNVRVEVWLSGRTTWKVNIWMCLGWQRRVKGVTYWTCPWQRSVKGVTFWMCDLLNVSLAEKCQRCDFLNVFLAEKIKGVTYWICPWLKNVKGVSYWMCPWQRSVKGVTYWMCPWLKNFKGVSYWMCPWHRSVKGVTYWMRPWKRSVKGVTYWMCPWQRSVKGVTLGSPPVSSIIHPTLPLHISFIANHWFIVILSALSIRCCTKNSHSTCPQVHSTSHSESWYSCLNGEGHMHAFNSWVEVLTS